MRLNNAIFGVLIAVFSFAVWAYSGTFPEMPGQAYGPALFPRLIAVGLLICAGALIVDGIRNAGSVRLVDVRPLSANRERLINVLLIPIGLLVYISLSDAMGFVPIAFALLTLLLWRFGTRLSLALMLAATITLFVHTLFYRFLHVPLPWGVLEPYAW
jgi:putative tricarboxylic transport membrane protein